MTQEHAIELKGLCIGYAGTEIYGNITAHADKGEMICLIGANGKGKSTLLKTIAGLQNKISGEILLNGKDDSFFNKKERSTLISFLPPRFPRIPNLKVMDIMGINCYHKSNWIGQIKDSEKKAITEALGMTGLAGFENRDSSKLSDGELQRCMIAGSLVKDSEIILFDEPTAFLDISNKFHISYLLKKLAYEKNKCIIFSSHDLQVSLDVSDRIWIMGNAGFTEGSPSEVLEGNKLNGIFSDSRIRYDKDKNKFVYNNGI